MSENSSCMLYCAKSVFGFIVCGFHSSLGLESIAYGGVDSTTFVVLA